MSIKLHNILLEGERESTWKEVVGTVNHNTSSLDRVIGSFKTYGLVDKENLITNSKTFLMYHLKTSLFNNILKDGSGGKEFALEVSKFIIKEVRRVVNDLGTYVFLAFSEKDVDKGMKQTDFDAIFTEIDYYFNVGELFASYNIGTDQDIDNGIKFSKDFSTTLNSLTPQIKTSIENILKSKV